MVQLLVHEGEGSDATCVHVFLMAPQCQGRVRLPLAPDLEATVDDPAMVGYFLERGDVGVRPRGARRRA